MSASGNTSPKRTGASRRRARVKKGQSATTLRVGIEERTIPIRCACGKRLARVSLTAPEGHPGRWSYWSDDLDRIPYSSAIEGIWADGWSNMLQKRNRKGIAGEIRLEGRWESVCPRCKSQRGGMTSQLVAVLLEARENGRSEIRLSSLALAEFENWDRSEILERWIATR